MHCELGGIQPHSFPAPLPRPRPRDPLALEGSGVVRPEHLISLAPGGRARAQSQVPARIAREAPHQSCRGGFAFGRLRCSSLWIRGPHVTAPLSLSFPSLSLPPRSRHCSDRSVEPENSESGTASSGSQGPRDQIHGRSSCGTETRGIFWAV